MEQAVSNTSGGDGGVGITNDYRTGSVISGGGGGGIGQRRRRIGGKVAGKWW